MRLYYGLLWGLMILSVMRTTVLVRRRDTSQFASVDGSAALAMAIVVVLLAALLINPRTRKVIAHMRHASPMVLLTYFGLAMISALWSYLPVFSAFRALEVIAVYVTAFVLISRYHDFFVAERNMLRLVMAVTILAFLYRALNVGLTIEALHTNTYTVTAGMGFLYTLGEGFRATRSRRRILRRWSAGFLFFLAIGTSVGSNIATALGLILVLTLSGFGRLIVIPSIFLVVIILVLMGVMGDILIGTVFAGRSIEDFSNLTGRNYLWQGYLDGFLERPLLGYGFAVGARVGYLFDIRSTTNTHNGFIEAILGIGIFGILILLYYFYALARELFYSYRMAMPGSIGMIGAIVMMAVNNNSKSLVGGAYDPTLVGIFVMIAFAHYAVFRRVKFWRRHRLELHRAHFGQIFQYRT